MTAARYLSLISVLLLPMAAVAQKKPLDQTVFDGWNSIRGTAFTRDGKWLAYSFVPQEGDATTYLRQTSDGKTITIPRGTGFQFSRDGQYAVGTIAPGFIEARKARRDKVKPDDQPKSSLVIVHLVDGTQTKIDKVTNFQIPTEDHGWILYRPATAGTPTPTPAAAGRGAGAGAGRGAAPAPAARTGEVQVLRNLATGKEEKLESVGTSVFDKQGTTFAYTTVTKDNKNDLVGTIDLSTMKKTTVASGGGKFSKVALKDGGGLLAFTSDRNDVAANPVVKAPEVKSDAKAEAKPEAKPDPKKVSVYSLYLFDIGAGRLKKIGDDSMPSGWSVNEAGAVSFSEKGTRVIYRTSPTPLPDPEEKPDDEKVSVDVWTWKDKRLPTQQLLQAAAERTRGYLATYDIRSERSAQLATVDMPNVTISDQGDGPVGLAVTSDPYEVTNSWNPGVEDVYVVDVESGQRRRIFSGVKGSYSLSPDGRYVGALVSSSQRLVVVDTAKGGEVDLTAKIGYPLFNELSDVPDFADGYGIDGWTKDGRMLVKDRFDIWACDPTAKADPVNLTHGRSRSLRYSRIDLDADEPRVDLKDVLFTTLNDETKAGSLARLKDGQISQIIAGEKQFGGVIKAKNAAQVVYTRQDFVEFPDLWLTDVTFNEPKKITDANPQQRGYNWGTAQLVQWTSLDGVPLKGVLIKPENFDIGKKYPMITYYYERNSDNLYSYSPPRPSASTVNFPLYVSNGYCVFIPDIPYKVGYPGNSAVNAIVPGVQSIVSRGYIDPKRLGIQGQSWGGYQTAFLVTQTDMFAAAEAGAPVSDMFSAYGGIRYESGLVRNFNYETSQSRIGGTPWNATLKYIENSPLFWLERVKTPLMIMSNDKDGAVPHTQGIELMTAMRRLSKPAWMVVYNDEAHNLTQRRNQKDLSIRMMQFFDHFLKGAPMPEWMAKGIPAVDKGKNMGLEPAKP